MRLLDLIAALPEARVDGPTDREVGAIRTDSRAVQAGDVFIAYPGIKVDAHRFVENAIGNGASVVVVEKDVDVPDDVTRIIVPSGRGAWALFSAAEAGFPSRKLIVIGVTGTDGKTTTASLLGSILRAAGLKVGLITTVSAQIDDEAIDTGFHTTTPEPPEIQSYLAQMVDRGVTHAIIETTSHGLSLEKVLGIDYDVAILTNVTQDHLDFHQSHENYFKAKLRLFEMVSSSEPKPGVPKAAILNADDPGFEMFMAVPIGEQLVYGLDHPADITAIDIRLDHRGARFRAHSPFFSIPVETRLPGRFNVSNALAAIAASLVLNVPPRAIKAGLKALAAIPGRIESIDRGQPFRVIVDFAHTPNSLRRVLELARSLTKGKLSVVFGCAGERDAEKRPMMGQIAAELADRVYLTSEDPREEALTTIMEQVLTGVRGAAGTAAVIPDRGDAIKQALRDAKRGDLVLITGKGHEQSMCFGTVERPWSDQAAVGKVLTELGYPANTETPT